MEHKILRAWDKGKNTVRYIYKNESGRQVFGEEKFKWYFYVLERQFAENFSLFARLKNSDLIQDFEKTGTKYTKIYVNREHNSESLTIANEPCWEYRDRDLNIVLSKLKECNIKTFEGDLNLWKKWIVDTKPVFETEFKILFLDIETDDEKITGQPIPGEFQIFSIAFVDADTGKEGWLCCKDRTEKDEEDFLVKVAKIINGYDVLVGFNAQAFDFPYLKVRMAKYGIQIDWRKKFLQDHMVIFKKYGPQLPSYSLDSISKFVLNEGKVDHGKKIFQLFNDDRHTLKEYNLQDSRLMYKIELKTKFLSVAREINNIGYCSCDDQYISRKIDMMVLQQAHEDQHFHFRTVERKWDNKEEEKEEDAVEEKVFGKKKEEDEADEDTFEGAYVFEPVVGIHSDIQVLDFASLYPNAIKTCNISPDTLLTDETEDQPDPTKVISTPNGQYFRKDFIGILPKLIGKITDGRNRFKSLMKTVDPNSNEHKTYDRLQYAFKAMGLSFYGVCGLRTSRFFDFRVAESITLTGQFFIKKMAKYFESKNIGIVYGDTDSLFIRFSRVDMMDRIISNVKKICEHYAANDMNTDICTLEMAYDKGFSELILVTKKRYAGFLTYLDGKFLPEKKLYVAGLEYKRTDACPLLKKKQEELIKLILHAKGTNQQEMINYITNLKEYVFSDGINSDDFVCAQKLSKPVDKYANPNLMHLKVARQMMKDNKEVYVGDKIPYFIEDIDFEGKPIPRPMYLFRGKLCREYYWSKKIYAALKRVLEVVFKTIPWESFDIGIKVSKLRNTIKSGGFNW